MSRPTVSLNVVTFDEAARIGSCLGHVAPFVDEMVVVDQGSTDGTPDIARSLGAKVFTDVHHGYGDPSRPLAEEHSTDDWILVLDADETFVPGFLVSLSRLVANNHASGYLLARANSFGGQRWLTDVHLRLFRRGSVVWPPPGLHRQPCLDDTLVVRATDVVAIAHHKTWAEQLTDDESYERLAGCTGRFLALARERGVSGADLDAMTIAQAKALGFDCAAVIEATA